VRDIARAEHVSEAYLYTLRLPWLAPDITTAIINGRIEVKQFPARRPCRTEAAFARLIEDRR
jgi:hypothetical protein